MNKIIQVSSKEAREKLRCIQVGASRDDGRPVLTGIMFTDDGNMVSCDGYRIMHTRAPSEEMTEIEKPVNLRFEKKITMSTNIIEAEVIEGHYPDFCAVIPKEDPIIQVAVDPRMLGEMLVALPKDVHSVVISIHTKNQPVEIHSVATDDPFYMLLMPMRMPEDSNIIPRPRQ